MIKAIIFDYGGIFTEIGSWEPILAKFSVKYGKNKEEIKEVLKAWWSKARVNEIPSAKFWKELSKFLGEESDILRARCIEVFGWREEMVIFVKGLKKNYKLGMISNQIEDWLEYMIKLHKLDEIFDVISTSYNVGIAKPDLAIFKETIEKLGVKAEECVFIDDLKKNIPPAQELGMKAILFENMDQLKTALIDLGVEIN